MFPVTRRSVTRKDAVWRLAILLGLFLWPAEPADAGSGSVVSLPMPGANIRSGLQLEIDTRWIDGNGYRKVRVRVRPLRGGPAVADRTLEVTLRTNNWIANGGVFVTKTLTLEEGQTYAEVDLAVPQSTIWNQLGIETVEDGRRVRDLSARNLGLSIRNYYQWSEAWPATLFVDSDAPEFDPKFFPRARPASGSHDLPDPRSLIATLPEQSWNNVVQVADLLENKKFDDADLLRLTRDIPRTEIIPPSELPEDWIQLTSCDLMVISRDDLVAMDALGPARMKALRRWLRTGPVLCVYGVGDTFEELDLLERMFQLAPIDEASETRGWREPHAKNYGTLPSQKVYGLMQAVPPAGPLPTVRNSQKRRKGNKPPPDPRPFVWRGVGEGQLVAIAKADPFPGKQEDWAWILTSVGEQHWMWFRRHGMSLNRENRDFWDLLVAGVGRAPVNSFLLLISVFVVVIGPVNYYVLARLRRLYLLLVTVPLGAILITSSLLLYALLTDGLQTRVRIRSFTEIDQKARQVTSWSRQTYYAGVSPAEGLTFPADAAVYPVHFTPRDNQRAGHIDWDLEQNLKAGYLPSRTTSQFLVVESRDTERGMRFEQQANKLQTENHLGAPIVRLIVRTEQGELFASGGVAVDGVVQLSPADAPQEADAWATLLNRNRPKMPKGFDPDQMENVANLFGSTYYGYAVDNAEATPSFEHSVFERRLKGLVAQSFEFLPNRSYLAVVERIDEVAVGLEEARVEDTFQVVYGAW